MEVVVEVAVVVVVVLDESALFKSDESEEMILLAIDDWAEMMLLAIDDWAVKTLCAIDDPEVKILCAMLLDPVKVPSGGTLEVSVCALAWAINESTRANAVSFKFMLYNKTIFR